MSLYMICTQYILSILSTSPLRLVVRTLPFQGSNTGSNPVGDIDYLEIVAAMI